MKKLLLQAFLIVLTFPAYCQIEADSVFIYKDFKRAGTTAGLQYNHRDLESRKTETIKLDSAATADLKSIFVATKPKRFLQQKHGGEIIYAVVWFMGTKYNYIVEGDDNFARMVNLNTMRKWILNDPTKIASLHVLLMKNNP
ncbi:hypothetical protein [Pontibacter fetidus]|uniref:Uncharacterized protein n=1 Tax=Pontibacter fetidus TaxID=2700082 RepID=A0A6B2H8Q2_9BACT|nr:hypothetical protein [Pontibacter fetidus]NDK57007.1 hypothetical protein [Pontibacter fetidus]